MKYRHISAPKERFVVVVLVIDHFPTHQNSKPLLMSRYTTVTYILFYISFENNNVPDVELLMRSSTFLNLT